MLRRVIILAVLAAGVVGWYWTRWRPAHDYKALSVQLQNAVNQELTRAGITDRDILESLNQEHSRFGLTWIESRRRIHISQNEFPGITERLIAVAAQVGCRVKKHQEGQYESVLELGTELFLMQRLEFTTELPPSAEVLPAEPEVAVVIDDVAYDMHAMDRFAALGVPLTFAILPRDRNSKALAEKANGLNFGVILHMPMEPIDLAHNNPGGAGLYLKMTPAELKQQFDKNVASVPYIVGINNHMGSAFTADVPRMTLVLNWIKEKHLFFLDSHTNIHSVGPKIAKEIGLPCKVNETFLDNEDDQAAIAKQLDIVLKLALRRKRTIAIGHYRRKHLVQALAQKLPEFRKHGVHFVTLPTFYPKT